MILSAIYGINTFITQYDGKRDVNAVKQAFGLMLLSSVGVTLVIVAGIYLFRGTVLTLFINDSDAVAYGVQYLTVLLVVYIINSVKDAYGNALGAIGQVRLTLVVGLIAMTVNVVLDYALIYGKLGFSPLGIEGAAWSTLVSSIVGATGLIGFVYFKSYPFNVTIKEMFSFNAAFAKRVYATTLPLVFHEGLWSLGNLLYATAFGFMGVSALATFQLARTFNGYFMMGIFGFAYAANVMIGQKLSQEDPGEAIIYARKFTRLTIIASLFVSAAIAVLSPYIVRLFSQTSGEVQLPLAIS